MKKLTEERVKMLLKRYFESRKTEKRDAMGNPIVSKSGEIYWEEKPATVTGILLALGMTRREELEQVKNKKVKALIDRALLRVEEEAEEKLFSKESFQGAKFFLSANFARWRDSEAGEDLTPSLGVCTAWAE